MARKPVVGQRATRATRTPDKFLTIEQAAELLHLTTTQVWNQARAGTIPSVFLGSGLHSRRWFDRAEIERIAAERMPGSAA